MLYVFSFFAASQQVNNSSIKAIDFDCATDLLPSIHLLGRGNNFPEFLLLDIEKELKRQQESSILEQVRCLKEPTIKVKTVQLETDPSKSVLTTLSVSFPVEIVVKGRAHKDYIAIDQKYTVENMDKPGKEKLTQEFIVKRF